MSDEVPYTYTKAVGDRLRGLRRQRGMSLLAVEETSEREFKASVLGAYERGERIISVLRLQRLAEFYRVPVDQILPRSPGSSDGVAAGADGSVPFTAKRPVTIDLVRMAETDSIEGQVIRRYIHSIQSVRSGVPGQTIAIRESDLEALGRFFERDPTAMEVKLAELRLLY